MDEKKITFVDQTFRDAQQSLWGFTMRTDHITPIAEVMDQVGFKSIGTVGGHGMTVQTRILGEDPWERIRLLSKMMPNTPLETSFMIASLASFDIDTPRSIIELWIKRCVANGIRSFWNCDYQTDMETVRYFSEIAKNEGAKNVGGLMYTFSPAHDSEHWARKTRMIAEMKDLVDSIRIEDAGGVLTPQRTRELLKAVLENCDGIPIEFHSHCNMGLAPLCYLEAIKAGVTILHTAVGPLGNGTSLPTTESILRNAKRMGYTSDIDEDALAEVSAHFYKIAEEEGLPVGVPMEYDMYYFEHQVPGGMMTNLKRQLSEIGKGELLDQVLEEIIRVREEFGYPVMATPYSQMVGAQAVENILSGERYKNSADEAIKYILGFYGEAAGPIDQNVKDKIMALPRAQELADWQPQGRFKSLDALREEFGNDLSDDNLILRAMVPGLSFKNGKMKKPINKPIGNRTQKPVSTDNHLPQEFSVDVDGEVFSVKITPVMNGNGDVSASVQADNAKQTKEVPEGGVVAGMSGLLLSYKVKVGDNVDTGDTLATIEAMKMMRQLNSPHSGVVKEILAIEGETIESHDVLMVVK
ncbi:Pyruvate carboxylase (modular protein) [Desulfosarcina cetonica]|nr:Pyruvate carboxylase (modular protein) [Desulfosarcina cetonica]